MVRVTEVFASMGSGVRLFQLQSSEILDERPLE